MKIVNRISAFMFIVFFLHTFDSKVFSQNISEVLESEHLEEQLEQIERRTLIYENFRAIREDFFQKLKSNVLDTLSEKNQTIAENITLIAELKDTISKMEKEVTEAHKDRDQAIKEQNSILLLGSQLSKAAYNTIMWSLVLGLAILTVLALIAFKRAHIITSKTQSDLKELQSEFDEYKTSSRKRFEQQSIDHFNEIRKMKEGK